MKRCKVKPYEGDKKYIFISYCHKDYTMVFPIIERLSADGYRVWFDEGIDPGSEWPEIIADHLNSCALCVAFVSQNSVNSHNCKREINFALLKKKPFISVVLNETVLSLGMEMQLSATQAIFKHRLSSDEEFFQKLYKTQLLAECRSKPADQIKTEYQNAFLFFLTRKTTGEKIHIYKDKFNIGRSETSADYRILNNCTVGRVHAVITVKGDKCYLTDSHSQNGTFINDKQIVPERIYEICNRDRIRFSNEEFTFNLVKKKPRYNI